MRLLPLAVLLLPLSVAARAPAPESLAAVPRALLPAAEVRDAIQRLKHEPLRFAVAQPLALDQRDGVIDEPAPGVARWRLRIASEGAASMSLQLQDLQLPAGSELRLYGADGQDVQGPFNGTAVREGRLWLPVVRASEAVLEVRLPATSAPDLRLRIAQAFHGYRPLGAAGGKVGPGGSESGSCNINVVCAAGNDWRNEIRSTVYLVTDGVSLCTGSLMNNTRLDERPLVLTANHCGIRGTNVASLTAYFNLQSSSCAGNETGRVDQNVAGGSFLARDAESDFTLVALAGAVPASFNAFYAGWDARGSSTATSGATVHHPSGDEKKISLYSAAATRQDDICIGGTGSGCTGGFQVDSWQVRWSQGTTEQGSSGSALWNQDRRVIGVLSGGGASCADPGQPDFFGRLDRAWTASSTSSGQLKAHLDPTNSGALTLNSKNAGEAGTLPDAIGGGGGGAFGALLLLLPALRLRRRRAAT